MIKNENTRKSSVKYIIDVVEKTGGIRYTTERMEAYKSEALQILHSFPRSEIRDGFEDLVHFVTDRSY